LGGAVYLGRLPSGHQAQAETFVPLRVFLKVVFFCFSDASARLHEEALAAFGSPCAD
jgi:hypothetical protein